MCLHVRMMGVFVIMTFPIHINHILNHLKLSMQSHEVHRYGTTAGEKSQNTTPQALMLQALNDLRY